MTPDHLHLTKKDKGKKKFKKKVLVNKANCDHISKTLGKNEIFINVKFFH